MWFSEWAVFRMGCHIGVLCLRRESIRSPFLGQWCGHSTRCTVWAANLLTLTHRHCSYVGKYCTAHSAGSLLTWRYNSMVITHSTRYRICLYYADTQTLILPSGNTIRILQVRFFIAPRHHGHTVQYSFCYCVSVSVLYSKNIISKKLLSRSVKKFCSDIHSVYCHAT